MTPAVRASISAGREQSRTTGPCAIAQRAELGSCANASTDPAGSTGMLMADVGTSWVPRRVISQFGETA